MTAMAMQRRKDGKRSAPREKATGKKRDNGEREKKRQREGHGQKQRGGERGRPRHTETESGEAAARTRAGAGWTRPQPRREASPRAADHGTDLAGEVGRGRGGAGPVPAGPGRSGERRGLAGCEKGKEAEVPGGRGAPAGSGEGRRGGGLRKNAPTSCPARARKREPGHRARDRRARPRAPRRSPPRTDTRYSVRGPARPPPRCLGKWEEEGGGWGAAGSGGASSEHP